MEKSQSITKLATALKDFQAEVGNVPKDAVNPFFKSKYASLESVVETVKPILAKHGLSYAQFPSNVTTNGVIYGSALTTILMHESGDWLEATTLLIAKDQTPQGQGSAITYMRRYALSAVLGIATEDDDDGNEASKPETTAKIVSRVEIKPATPKTTPPAVVTELQQKKRIQELCLEKNSTLKLTEDYRTCVKMRTGLELEPQNYADIIVRLEATQ